MGRRSQVENMKQEDGKMSQVFEETLYHHQDMVKVGCKDCDGCSACCRSMGQSIVLNPWDIAQMTVNLNTSMTKLLSKGIVELHVEDNMILPNLSMCGEKESCSFLDQNGRCSIHSFRPGICRLFPLGRQYGEDEISYFLLEGACPKENKTKVKVKKWLDLPDLQEYEAFLMQWHSFCKEMKVYLTSLKETEWQKKWNLYVLQVCYLEPYKIGNDFYRQAEERMKKIRVLYKREQA